MRSAVLLNISDGVALAVATGMLSPATLVCAGMIVCAGASAVSAQTVIPDADRYIKLGTRIPEVDPGEGGELRVVAEPQWCHNANYVLEVRLLRDTGGFMPVVRMVAGPGNCEWLFTRMPVGRYEALIMSGGDERIVAMTGITVLSRGATMLMLAASAAAEIEGRVTSLRALPSPLRLIFQRADGKSWTAPVAADGSYHVTMSGVGERAMLSVWAAGDDPRQQEPTRSFNLLPLRPTPIFISEGLHRVDLVDVTLPPVVLHIEVPPVTEAGYGDFAEAMVDNQRGPGFKLLRGLHGEFLATYGEHKDLRRAQDRHLDE